MSTDLAVSLVAPTAEAGYPRRAWTITVDECDLVDLFDDARPETRSQLISYLRHLDRPGASTSDKLEGMALVLGELAAKERRREGRKLPAHISEPSDAPRSHHPPSTQAQAPAGPENARRGSHEDRQDGERVRRRS